MLKIRKALFTASLILFCAVAVQAQSPDLNRPPRPVMSAVEPSSTALLAAGLASLWVARKRARRKKSSQFDFSVMRAIICLYAPKSLRSFNSGSRLARSKR